jgi:hypothetical protein
MEGDISFEEVEGDISFEDLPDIPGMNTVIVLFCI